MKGLKQWGEMRISKWHFRLVSLINTAFLFLSLLHYYLVLVLSAASSPTFGPNDRNPPKIIGKLTGHTNASNILTNFWHGGQQITGNENEANLLRIAGKNRETITSELILWRILTFWNHCVPQCLFPAIPSYPISTHLIFVNFKGGLLHNRTEQLQLLLQLT